MPCEDHGIKGACVQAEGGMKTDRWMLPSVAEERSITKQFTHPPTFECTTWLVFHLVLAAVVCVRICYNSKTNFPPGKHSWRGEELIGIYFLVACTESRLGGKRLLVS